LLAGWLADWLGGWLAGSGWRHGWGGWVVESAEEFLEPIKSIKSFVLNDYRTFFTKKVNKVICFE
jgi:hypothetical protein